jgi:hypothetical protein
MEDNYNGPERREFVRLDYVTPLMFKICRKEILDKLLEGYTSDISQAGLLCNIKEKVKEDDILWLSFDRATLNICRELDRRSLIYQNGIIGKVVRIEPQQDGTNNVGVQFIVREEKNLTHIYPKIKFLKNEP